MTSEHEQSQLPLDGLTVVDLSSTVPGAQATRFLADCGAEVIGVERPGGSPARRLSGWPFLGRGKQSIALDLHEAADRDVLLGLLDDADVTITTWRPGVAERLGLAPDQLRARNPRLVTAALTGYGSMGPWCGLKGYEALVLARLGIFHDSRRFATRPGPAFVSVPYASWATAMSATQGVLAALLEREGSGRGQHVEANLVQGFASLDTWSWFVHLIGERYPGAFVPTELFDEKNRPAGHFIFPLLVAPTSDGTWLQFAQTQQHLLVAFFKALGLEEVFTDPKWKGFPFFEDSERRVALWELCLQRVRHRTLAEWEKVFDDDPNVYAEQFRRGPEVLEHAQLLHDGRTVTVQDAALGPVRQPSTLVHIDERSLPIHSSAPRLDEHGAALRARAGRRQQLPDGPEGSDTTPRGLPLEGVVVLELAQMFAAPFAATMLTDLGARVWKIESLEGDGIRNILEFPEAGGSRVMQGKESIAVDLDSDEGLAVVHELAKHADLVLMGFRAGAAQRAKVDVETLRAINPRLLYLSAPGYGTGGPCGHRPAYAPSIGAAAGFSLANAPDVESLDASAPMGEVKHSAMRLGAATTTTRAQADGVAAHGVAVAMLAGLLGRARGRDLGPMTTTMLSTCTHALFDSVVSYTGAAGAPSVDYGSNGFNALYRLYETAAGWIMLAAPQSEEWAALVGALAPYAPLATDPRFATEGGRRTHDAELAETLARVFVQRSADSWEADLTAADVGCAVSRTWPSEAPLLSEEIGRAGGYVTDAASPIWDEYPRQAPVVRLSRSATQAPGGCTLGEHTEAVLREVGFGQSVIDDLRRRRIIG